MAIRRACATAAPTGLSTQRRCHWFDRFIRNPTSGEGITYVGENRNNTVAPGHSTRTQQHDEYFGYIPNYYAMEERALFDRKTLEPDRIRPPCGEIPDVTTFLERASQSDPLAEYDSQFEDWEDLMTCSYMEMVYKKLIPMKFAKSIFTAREMYNNGHIFHMRNNADWKDWTKARGKTAPFPENYYPHMRYVLLCARQHTNFHAVLRSTVRQCRSLKPLDTKCPNGSVPHSSVSVADSRTHQSHPTTTYAVPSQILSLLFYSVLCLHPRVHHTRLPGTNTA